MDLGLRGKTALVTGGSRGLGKAIGLALADEGCRVAICARGREALAAAASGIRSRGVEALAIEVDVTAPEAPQRALGRALEAFGGLDILVNNAGGGGERRAEPIEATPDEVWESHWDLNTRAVARFTRAAIPLLRRRGEGRVVTVVSKLGREGGGRPWYTMAKSASLSLMKTLAMDFDLARAGLTFNSVAPGAVLCEDNPWARFRREDPEGFARKAQDQFPRGRLGTPEEVAAVVVFLCSAQASLVSGACIAVDGGESRAF